jgi:hypothetical protein
MPEATGVLAWYMEKFFPIGKVAMKVLSPISKTVFKIQLPDKEVPLLPNHFFGYPLLQWMDKLP